jgi:hypothetical protein
MPLTSGIPCFSAAFRTSVLGLTFALLALPCLGQQPKVFAPHKPVAPRLPQPKTWHKPAVPQSLIGGLWMIDPNLKSSVYLKNDLKTSPLSVTPILWLSNGVKYSLPVVNLDPSGTAIVDINQSLAAQGVAPYATLMGYVEFDYQWPWPALCATIRNIDPVHSIIFNYNLQLGIPPLVHSHPNPSAQDAQPQSDDALQPQTQTLEGLWWKQEPRVSGFVALSNPGAQAVVANLAVSDAQGNSIGQHTVTVSPNGTKMVTLDELLPSAAGSSGGLRLTYTGPENALLVSAGLRDDASGYSANIPFASTPTPADTATTVSYAELGLMTGAADPMLSFPTGTVFKPYTVVRNISSRSAVITPNLWWMAGSAPGNAALPQLTLAPYQSLNLDLSFFLAQVGMKNFNGSVNLVLDITASAPRGAVLVSSGSVDQKNTYVFQVVPESAKPSMAKSLSYWSTANGDDTMVTLWNPADEAQDFVFTLFFSGGSYLHPVHLEPRATLMFNVSELIHSQLPDSEGNVIPLGVHDGSAEISGPQGESQYILVAMDAGTYNVQKATCGTWCRTCQGAVDSWVYDNPFALPMRLTHQLSLTVQYHSGTQVNDTGSAGWNSSNTSVATVNNGLVTAVSAGSLSANAFDDSFPLYSSGCYNYSIDCPLYTGTGGSAPGIVQQPTSLRVLSDTTVIDMSYLNDPGCTNGSWGIAIAIHYQVLDQNGLTISSFQMEPQEEDPILHLNTWGDIGPSGYPGTSQFTDGNGQFWDAPLGGCNPGAPFSFTDTQYISILVNGTRYPATGGVRTNNWSTSSSFPGHGSVSNGGDISKTR